MKAAIYDFKASRSSAPIEVAGAHRGASRNLAPLYPQKSASPNVTKSDVTAMMKDIMAGKTRTSEKTKKLRGRSIVRGGLGAASRTVGLLGGIFTYARDELGIIEANPTHGVRKRKTLCGSVG